MVMHAFKSGCSLIIEAASLAAKAHAGQQRKYSGDPYIVHPMRVAGRVTLLHEADEAMIAAAWLHDVIEDTSITFDMINRDIHPNVAVLVRDLTNVKDPKLTRAEQKAKDHERLTEALWQAKLIKLIDRTDNLLDVPKDLPFRKTYARETVQLMDRLLYTDNKLAKHTAALVLFSLASDIVEGRA